MNKGIALLVGLKRVNPTNYNNWDGTNGCWGCELDVDNIQRILHPLNYRINTLKTAQATSRNILSSLNSAAEQLDKDDMFVFYFSGHGGQQPDHNYDEADGRDETIVAFDREINDDELDNIWMKMRQEVRIVMISDSCNSGTNYRNIRTIENSTPMKPLSNRRESDFKAQMIHIGGCQDGSSSIGYQEGGAFTKTLCNAWENGNFNGSYSTFYEKICSLITSGQEPQYNEYGQVSNEFKNQKPFIITESETSEEIVSPSQCLFKGKVTANQLNIRKGPGINYQDVGDLYEGDQINITNVDGRDVWVEIGSEKWAALAYRGRKYIDIT